MHIIYHSCVFIYINSKFNTIKIFAVLVFSLVYTLVIPFGSGFLPPLQYIFHPRLRENDGSCCVSGCRWGFAKVSGCLKQTLAKQILAVRQLAAFVRQQPLFALQAACVAR